MEARLLLAFILMGAVLFLTPYFYKPPMPPPGGDTPVATAPAEQTEAAQAPSAPSPPAAAPAPAPAAGRVAADQEETFVIENERYRVTFSNRGGVAKSWILKDYKNTSGELVDLVSSGSSHTGYPFSIVYRDGQPATDLNQVLYAAKPSADGLGIEFEYSDGAVSSRKSFRFEPGKYLTQVESEVFQNGNRVPHMLSWRGGFGDGAVLGASATQHAVYYEDGSGLTVNDAKAAKDGPLDAIGRFSFAGVEDMYFAAAFLPSNGGPVQIRTFSDYFAEAPEGKPEPHAGAAVGGEGNNHLALFVGPKDIDVLRSIDPKLEQLVDFGWFSFIARPLFLSLNWVANNITHNYGWAIVLVTIFINFVLLPLKFSSMKSMKKMQALQPQIAAINEKYKGISLRDPRKAQQNQEVMDLYKRNNVNPAGGCVPMLLQIPFFFAFYKVLTVAIEMRGANWLWVTDLSQPETLPIRILPIAMMATQFVMQKMTPTTSIDPAQQRIMLLMPLMLGFMFYGVSSGLVLYWLTGNVVGIAQQWFFNRTTAVTVTQPAPAPKKKGRN